MKYKSDWDEAQKHLTALWHGEIIDRPCIAVRAPGGNNVPRPRPESAEQKWVDPEFVVRDAVASFELARIDPNWEAVAQQRIWQIHPPETEEEKLRREFFGDSSTDGGGT